MSLQPGDIVYLGGSAPAVYVDGDATRALAGAPGYAYARVMVDATGARFSPHYRATDIASDNRLPPGVETLTHHAFAIPNACPSVTVTATLLYRPLPYDLSTERSWNARDYVILETKTVLALQ